MYTLIIEDRHGKQAAEISFENGSYAIGRVEGNDVVLPSNSVSRTHARIFVSNNKCYIDDLGSTAGVIINGVAIKTRTEIGHGARIKIGDYMLYLEYKDNADSGSGQEILKTQIVTGAQTGFKIVRVGDKFKGEEFMLTETVNSIGRTEDNYILLSDPSVSRSHAEIINQGLSFKLVDRQSANGSFVNGKRVMGEMMLQSGDELRFGNLRFVFVPAKQIVDLEQYSKRVADSRNFLMIILALVGILVVVCAVGIIFLLKDNEKSVNVVPPDAAAEDEASAKFNEQLKEANTHFAEGRLSNANDILVRLAEKAPNDSRVKELQIKVADGFENEKIIKEGDELFKQKLYQEAIEKYGEVSQNASQDMHNRAKQRIEEAEGKYFLASFKDARSQCKTEVNADCLENLCSAALALKETGKHKQTVEDAKSLLTSIIKDKKNSKFAAQANKCLKQL